MDLHYFVQFILEMFGRNLHDHFFNAVCMFFWHEKPKENGGPSLVETKVFFGLDAKAKERSANRIEKLIVFDDFANEEYIYIF